MLREYQESFDRPTAATQSNVFVRGGKLLDDAVSYWRYINFVEGDAR